MPEAVIVSAARTPIGRANKGSLTEMRPDDLTAFIVKTALDKIPALDPNTIDDHYLGCGLPGGESGNNMARVVNVLNGMDDVPGATITRYCSSSVQTTRMAFHAIKAGEGDVFISSGVETVSRFMKGTSDHWPDTHNHAFDEAKARTDKAAEGGQGWHDPREDGSAARRLHRDGPDRRERRQDPRPEPPGARRVRRPLAEPRREGDQRRLLGPRDHPGDHARAAPSSAPTTAPAPA